MTLMTSQDLLKGALEPLELEAPAHLYQREVELEQMMKGVAVESYKESLAKKLKSGNAAEDSAGNMLMSRYVQSITEAISEWYADATKQRAGSKHVAIRVLKRFESQFNVVAAIALRNCINIAGATNTTRHSIYKAIANELEAELHLREARKHDEQLYKVLSASVNKKGDFKHRVDAFRFVSNNVGAVHKSFSDAERTHVANLLLDLTIRATGLFELEYDSDLSNGKHKKTYNVVYTARADELISKHREVALDFVAARWPMVVPPLDWEHRKVLGQGYFTCAQPPLSLVKAMNKRISMEYQNFNMPEVYKAVNTAQRTPWRINKKVLELMEECIEREVELKKLNLRKPNPTKLNTVNEHDREVINKVAEWRKDLRAHRATESLKAKKAQMEGKVYVKTDMPRPAYISDNEETLYMQFKNKNRTEYQRSAKYMSQHRSVFGLAEVAKLYAEYDKIYMPYTLDFRGRIYCASILSPQGADHSKALLQFAKGEKITEEGIEWVYFHASGLLDFDKECKEARIQYVKDNMDLCLAIAEDPLSVPYFYKCDKPFQLYATCLEIAGIQEHGTNWVTRQHIALDGSCSGIQHYSALLQDEIGGRYVNLIPSDVREDIYLAVRDRAEEIVNKDAALSIDEAIETFFKKSHKVRRLSAKMRDELSELSQLVYMKLNDKPLPEDLSEGMKETIGLCIKSGVGRIYYARQWQKSGITRGVTKRPTMTYSYSATISGMREQVFEDHVKPLHTSIMDKHKEVVKGQNDWYFDGKGYMASCYMGDVLWTAIERTVVKAAEMMGWIKKVCGLIMKTTNRTPIRWKTPVGFMVVQDYRSQKTQRIECSFMGVRTRINMSCYWDAKKKKMVHEPWEASLDSAKAKSGLCPNIIHSLDAAHLMKILIAAASEGMDSFALVHDSFATSPNNTSRFSQIIRETFVDMYKDGKTLNLIVEQLLEQVPEENRKDIPPLPKLGKLDLDAIKDSEFCFA